MSEALRSPNETFHRELRAAVREVAERYGAVSPRLPVPLTCPEADRLEALFEALARAGEWERATRAARGWRSAWLARIGAAELRTTRTEAADPGPTTNNRRLFDGG